MGDANTDEEYAESSSFKGTELFLIPNVYALNISYSFFVLTRYSLFIFPLPSPYISLNKRERLYSGCTQHRIFFCTNLWMIDVSLWTTPSPKQFGTYCYPTVLLGDLVMKVRKKKKELSSSTEQVLILPVLLTFLKSLSHFRRLNDSVSKAIITLLKSNHQRVVFHTL